MERVIRYGAKRIRQDGVFRTAMDAHWFLLRNSYTVETIVALRYAKLRIWNGYRALAPPFRTISIDPDVITKANRSIDKYLATGKIAGGDWDLETTKYDESPKHRGVIQRFIEGKPWEETAGYQACVRELRETGEVDGCRSIEALKERYSRIDDLFESVREHGYRPERRHYDDSRVSTELDQICISIGRDGDLIFCGGGNHRLSITKILDVESVPVRVVQRHRLWQEVRESARKGDGKEGIDHPDLEDLKPVNSVGERR